MDFLGEFREFLAGIVREEIQRALSEQKPEPRANRKNQHEKKRPDVKPGRF